MDVPFTTRDTAREGWWPAVPVFARWTGLGGHVLALVSMAICLTTCRFLYQRKIFLRL